MIVSPTNAKEWQMMASFLAEYAHVHPSADLVMIGWVERGDGELKIVCGMHGFMGKACQIHIAFAPNWKFSPRQMLHEVFKYAFVTRGCEILLGVVNSKNQAAMLFDMHLGFKVLYAIPKMHDDGGDIVLVGMYKADCKYLNEAVEVDKQMVGNA